MYTKGKWNAGKAHTDMVYGDDWQQRPIAYCYSPNAEANARLIAQAPRMYEALKNALEASHDPRVEKILMEAIAGVETK